MMSKRKAPVTTPEQRDQEKPKFVIGDVVCLKSGGMPMIVCGHRWCPKHGPLTYVIWMPGEEATARALLDQYNLPYMDDHFPTACLKAHEPPTDDEVPF